MADKRASRYPVFVKRTRWEDVKNGDFGNHSGNCALSLIIQALSHSAWSHSFNVYRDGYGKLWAFEALNKIALNPLEDYHKDFDKGQVEIYGLQDPELTQAMIDDEIRDAVDAYVGEAYDWLGTASLAVVLPIQRLVWAFGGRWTVPSPVRTTAMKCSELCLRRLVRLIQRHHPTGLSMAVALFLDRESFIPRDLHELFLKKPLVAPVK